MRHTIIVSSALCALAGWPVFAHAAPRNFHCHIDGIGEQEKAEGAQLFVTIDTDALIVSGKLNMTGTTFDSIKMTKFFRPGFNDYLYEWDTNYNMTEEMARYRNYRVGVHRMHFQMGIGNYSFIFIDDPEMNGFQYACN